MQAPAKQAKLAGLQTVVATVLPCALPVQPTAQPSACLAASREAKARAIEFGVEPGIVLEVEPGWVEERVALKDLLAEHKQGRTENALTELDAESRRLVAWHLRAEVVAAAGA